MPLSSFVFARRSEGVAWHLQGRLTREACEAHRESCLKGGWDVTPVQPIEVEVDVSLYAPGEVDDSPMYSPKC